MIDSSPLLSKIEKQLEKLDQKQLLSFMQALSFEEQARCFETLSRIDSHTFKLQKQLLISSPPLVTSFEPPQVLTPQTLFGQKGRKVIEKGGLGIIFAAGGQASRLGTEQPKGCFPITVCTKKSLFQLFAEKIRAAEKKYATQIPVAFMTSPHNHKETVSFFQKHQLFGLSSDQLYFFQQDFLPALTSKGELFFESSGTIAQAPNGNGKTLHTFYQNGLWNTWKKKGVHSLLFLPIDNPLADPCDENMIGCQIETDSDIVVKCVPRFLDEKVGVLVKSKDKIQVLEYIDSDHYHSLFVDTKNYAYANISVFCIRMNWIPEMLEYPMPLHMAKKIMNTYNPKPHQQITKQLQCKFEYFIFDILPMSTQVQLLYYPREEHFAPLKSIEGIYGIEYVHQKLIQKDRKQLERITGKKCPEKVLEISQELYFLSCAQKTLCQTKTPPDQPLIELKDLFCLNSAY